MSLIHELRESDNHIDVSLPYEPLFLSVVKRTGVFIMSVETLNAEALNCIRKTGKTFDGWLAENKLKIVQANIKDHYKIYY